jgi:hypothetical protein
MTGYLKKQESLRRICLVEDLDAVGAPEISQEKRL